MIDSFGFEGVDWEGGGWITAGDWHSRRAAISYLS